jgi:hypothetical protein
LKLWRNEIILWYLKTKFTLPAPAPSIPCVPGINMATHATSYFIYFISTLFFFSASKPWHCKLRCLSRLLENWTSLMPWVTFFTSSLSSQAGLLSNLTGHGRTPTTVKK